MLVRLPPGDLQLSWWKQEEPCQVRSRVQMSGDAQSCAALVARTARPCMQSARTRSAKLTFNRACAQRLRHALNVQQ